jgi:serine protease SohB
MKIEKARKKAQAKKEKKADTRARPRVFVIHFRGDIKATAVASLREEVTAVLTSATPADEVLVCLENAGGLVHEHGLAASQLLRIKEKKIPLIVAVDKVAASGGYLMACVANRIIAAPFAVVGSIGVLAQLPNFHRLLDKHGIDFEQVKAGEFKRTLTLFGKNTEKERAKLKEEIEDTHQLFKNFVSQHRPDLDMTRVATGEHWYGARALELKSSSRVTTTCLQRASVPSYTRSVIP